jgi:UDP-N-acetylmuramoylalanine--D-glutamate ligase
MIASPAFHGKSYAVLGLARSGRAVVDALVASGAEVMAWDASEAARSAIPPSERIRIADPLANALHGYDGVVVSPGVPLNRHPIADRARNAGVPLIGDIELFAQARASLPPHKVVGITGTNGKSTTTALIHHICRTAGLPATMAGNIGYPILGQDPLPENGVYVLELSSYQIDLTHSLDCDVAVLLNVTPDHLDRYESYEAYRASKFRLFEMQSRAHHGVIGAWDPALNEMAMDMRGGPGSWSTQLRAPDAAAEQALWPALQGPHNAENVSAALSATFEIGIPSAVALEALASYRGLPHRMERIAERNGVLFVNDSKATNPNSAAPALAAYPKVHWIVGGLPKSDDLDACEPFLNHVRAAYTIGEAGPMFAQLLEGKVPVKRCEMLHEAVSCAASAAEPGEVVLLSPACASFDQFRDYEARGDAFRAAVEALV